MLSCILECEQSYSCQRFDLVCYLGQTWMIYKPNSVAIKGKLKILLDEFKNSNEQELVCDAC